MKRISDDVIEELYRTTDLTAITWMDWQRKLADAQLSADKEEEENIREDESKTIIRCVKDCIRVHPDWNLPRLLELLEFREETRQVMGRRKKYLGEPKGG